jgi:hypothetical protein
MMKMFRGIFFLLFVLTVAYTGFVIARGFPGIKQVSASKQAKEAELQGVNESLGKLNLQYRGFLESGGAIPDSLKIQETGNTMRIQQEYHKNIFKLENEVRELERLIRKDDRNLAEIYSGLKTRIYVTGALAILFLAGAIITSRKAIRS